MATTAAKREPTQPTLVGAIFDKYPEVNSISWDQYFDGAWFYVEPWSVVVNGGKRIDGEEPLSEQEHAAIIELEDLLVLAAGGKKGAGILDFTTRTAVNMGALLRTILGDGVIVTINRDGSIEREESETPSVNADIAEFYAEKEAKTATFKAHVLACGQCTSAIHDNERRISLSYMCGTGRQLAEVLGDASDEKALWDRVREENDTDEQVYRVAAKVGAKLDKMRRRYRALDQGERPTKSSNA